MLMMERLVNIDKLFKDASISWEILQIQSKFSMKSLMVPLYHSQKIMIFGIVEDNQTGQQRFNSILIDPKRVSEETVYPELDF